MLPDQRQNTVFNQHPAVSRLQVCWELLPAQWRFMLARDIKHFARDHQLLFFTCHS